MVEYQPPYPMYVVREQARTFYDHALTLTHQSLPGTLDSLPSEGDLVKKVQSAKQKSPVSVQQIRKITREALDKIVKLKGPASAEHAR